MCNYLNYNLIVHVYHIRTNLESLSLLIKESSLTSMIYRNTSNNKINNTNNSTNFNQSIEYYLVQYIRCY